MFLKKYFKIILYYIEIYFRPKILIKKKTLCMSYYIHPGVYLQNWIVTSAMYCVYTMGNYTKPKRFNSYYITP